MHVDMKYGPVFDFMYQKILVARQLKPASDSRRTPILIDSRKGVCHSGIILLSRNVLSTDSSDSFRGY